MPMIPGFLTRARGSNPILVFQMAVLAMLVSEYNMLEIIYTSGMKYMEEGGTLTLNCTIRHRQDQSSQLEAHWYKKAGNQNEMEFGKELECLQLSHSSDPSTSVVSFLLLKIQSVNQSDSGRYQCRAKIMNAALTAVGHFIRVNVTGTSIVNTTERTEGDFQSNKALSVDSQLEKMWAVPMVFWIIVYVKGLVP
nr:CD160 antigen isoform X2 [Dromaius novaehollandiae]